MHNDANAMRAAVAACLCLAVVGGACAPLRPVPPTTNPSAADAHAESAPSATSPSLNAAGQPASVGASQALATSGGAAQAPATATPAPQSASSGDVVQPR